MARGNVHRARKTLRRAGRQSQRTQKPDGAQADGGTSPARPPKPVVIHTDETRNAHERSSHVPAACVAVLLGMAAGMLACGVIERLGVIFGPGPTARGAACTAIILSIAVGIRVPQQLAVWLTTTAWRRFTTRDGRSTRPSALIGSGEPDQPLFWMVLSVIALLTGMMTAALPITAGLGATCYAWFQDHFVWSAIPRVTLQLVTGMVVCIGPAAGLGLSISCIHHVSCRHGQWNANATGLVMIGVAGGTTAALQFGALTKNPNLPLLAAALPILLAAIVSVAVSSRGRDRSTAAISERTTPLPTWADRWPTLLRVGVVCVGLSAAGALALSQTDGASINAHRPPPGIGWLALGIGVLLGNRVRRDGLRSIGGFGVACAVAGVAVMAGAIASVSMGVGMYHPGWYASAGLIAVGFAAAYGQQVVLNRVAGRARIGATMLARIVGFGTLLAWAGTAVSTHWLGDATSLALLALCLVALGGMLIIYEPGHSRRARRVRLCGIFSAIAAMIILMPPPRPSPESRARADERTRVPITTTNVR